MRILHVHYRYDAYGGAEQYLHDLCQAQIERGHEIIVLTSPGMQGSPLRGEKICLAQSSAGIRSGRRAQKEVLQIVRDTAPDIVHLHHIHGFISPLIVRALLKSKPAVQMLHNVGLVCFHNGKQEVKIFKNELCRFPMGLGCSLRGCFPFFKEGLKKTLIAQWEMETAKIVDKILVPSHYIKTELLSNGFSAAKIEVLPYYTRKEGAKSPKVESAQQGRVILFVGRLEAIKGILHFITALHRIKDKPWRAEVIGDGPAWQEARDLSNRLALDERITFLGWLPPERIDEHYRNAYMVVVPSLIPESFGIVGIEAMAFRRPVIAFDAGGIAEWLIDNETGFLVERGNVNALADKMCRLLRDPSLVKTMGERGQARVEQYYRQVPHLKRLFTIYEEVMSNRHKVLATS